MTASKRKLNLTFEFERMCHIEPRLLELLEQARLIDREAGEYFCANEAWIKSFRPKLELLAGWYAAKPELRTEHAYDVAGDAIINALPDCRECGCMVAAWEEMT